MTKTEETWPRDKSLDYVYIFSHTVSTDSGLDRNQFQYKELVE